MSVLEDIILGVREDLEERQRNVPIEELKRLAARAPSPGTPTPRSAATGCRSSRR